MIGKFKGQPGEALRLDNWRAEEAQRQVFVIFVDGEAPSTKITLTEERRRELNDAAEI